VRKHVCTHALTHVSTLSQALHAAGPVHEMDKTELRRWKVVSDVLAKCSLDSAEQVRTAATSALSVLVLQAVSAGTPPDKISLLLSALDPKKTVKVLSSAQSLGSSLQATAAGAQQAPQAQPEATSVASVASVPSPHVSAHTAHLPAHQPRQRMQRASAGAAPPAPSSSRKFLAPSTPARRSLGRPASGGSSTSTPNSSDPVVQGSSCARTSSSERGRVCARALSEELLEEQCAQLLETISGDSGSSGRQLEAQLRDPSWKLRHEALSVIEMYLVKRLPSAILEAEQDVVGAAAALGLMRLLTSLFVAAAKHEINIQVPAPAAPALCHSLRHFFWHGGEVRMPERCGRCSRSADPNVAAAARRRCLRACWLAVLLHSAL